jgi:hypothetical protein
MNEKLHPLFLELTKKFIAFLPTLFTGIILLIIGWFLGWLAKRLVIQISVILKLERFLVRFSWGRVFSKADVRYGLYRFIGNIVFIIIFIIFLYFALTVWDLKYLSDLLARGISLLPKATTALIVFCSGWFIANWTGKSIQRALLHEHVPGSMLISYFAKLSLIILFSAITLFELNIAREIVMIGFATIFITLGAIAVVITAYKGKEFLKKQDNIKDKED